MLVLRKILFLLGICYFWKTTELAVVEVADFSVTYQRNSSEAECKDNVEDSHKPSFSRRISGPIPTPKCTHPYYCEDVEGYPSQQLQTILTANKDLQKFFGVDKEPIENRIVSRRDAYLCATIERVVFPRALKNLNGEWKYVVNQPGGFQQGVRTETCVENQRGCKFVDPPLGYSTSCTEKVSYRRMLSVSSTGVPVGDLFALPMACCCSYTFS